MTRSATWAEVSATWAEVSATWAEVSAMWVGGHDARSAGCFGSHDDRQLAG